jgi:hypothetical protein
VSGPFLSQADAFRGGRGGLVQIGMRIRFIFHGWRLPALLAAALMLAGCVASPGVSSRILATEPARLAIINLTSRTWHITVSAIAGGEPRVIRIEPQAKVELDLARGDYSIEQTLVALSGKSEATRRFPASFEAGQTYQWPLATLGDKAAGGDIAEEPGGASRPFDE